MEDVSSVPEWRTPKFKSDRQWKEPEVIILESGTLSNGNAFVNAYDAANRRWYRMVANHDMMEDRWSPEAITKHINNYYTVHRAPPDWNLIDASNREHSPVSFKRENYEFMARAIQGNVHYSRQPADILPCTAFHQVKQKIHLNHRGDRCIWNGIQCALKRVEFSGDIKSIEREIRMRETLIKAFSPTPPTWPISQEFNTAFEDQFRVVPILSVVHKNANTDKVRGILLPYGGPSLEDLAGGHLYGMRLLGLTCENLDEVTDDLPAPALSPLIPVTEYQLPGLVQGVWAISKAGLVHGDINDRNILAKPDGRLVLIHLGEAAEEYKGDAYMLGTTMLWITDRVQWSGESRKRVRRAARELTPSGDFQECLAILQPELYDP